MHLVFHFTSPSCCTRTAHFCCRCSSSKLALQHLEGRQLLATLSYWIAAARTGQYLCKSWRMISTFLLSRSLAAPFQVDSLSDRIRFGLAEPHTAADCAPASHCSRAWSLSSKSKGNAGEAPVASKAASSQLSRDKSGNNDCGLTMTGVGFRLLPRQFTHLVMLWL